jgi:small subunit ribosomal protein S6
MRQYEVVYIIDPQLEEDQQNALVERFQTLIRDNGGEIQLVDRWERRRMAYEIKGRREGYYVVMNFQGTQATEAELTRVFGITDGVLRSMIVRMDERRADKAIAEAKAAAEAKAKAQEEARVAAEAAAAAEAQAAAEAAAAAPAAVEAPAAAEAPAEGSQGQDDTATGTVQEATETES